MNRSDKQFVIRLKNGNYWISSEVPLAANIEDAAKYPTRWLALGEMSKAGPVMHMAAIVEYKDPGERQV